MPTTKLTAANIKFRNIRAGINDQHLLRSLANPVDIVDHTGKSICCARIQQAGGGNLRLGCPALFGKPLPPSVCPSGHILSVGDILDWNINAHNQYVLERVTPVLLGLPATAISTHGTPMTPRNGDISGGDSVINPPWAPSPNTVNFCTQLVNLRLVPIHTLNIGDILIKGGAKKNTNLCKSCARVPHKCLCYYWKCGDKVFYVGSASPYKNHKSSLLGRVLNYLQNHTTNKRGGEQVNQRVFKGVNLLIKKNPVEFGIFEFDFLTLRDRTLLFQECSENSDVIGMLEHTLICHFKLLGQAVWNM